MANPSVKVSFCLLSIPERILDSAILTDYAVTTSYPGNWHPVSEEEYRHAVAMATELVHWAEEIIQFSK